MKSILFFTLLILPIFAQNQTNHYQRMGLSLDPPRLPDPVAPAIQYSMRSISRTDPRFIAVLEIVSREVRRLEAEELQYEGYRVQQTLAPGEFLVCRVNSDRDFHIVAPGIAVADGSILYGTIALREELYTYTNVLGAKTTVRSYRFDSFKPLDLTAENFIALLKEGMKFPVTKGTVTIQCKPCNGAGKLPLAHGDPRTQDGKKPCQPCRGEGKITMPQQVIIQW